MRSDDIRGARLRAQDETPALRVNRIAIFYLPSYSPELNPDEMLNADLKQKATTTAPARTKVALTRTAIGALRSIQKQPARVESYFGQKDVAYAT